MLKALCTLRDVKAGIYYTPVCYNSPEEFKRSVAEVISAKLDAPVVKYPQDFQLFLVGSYDEHTGIVVGSKAPQYMCDASSLVLSIPDEDNNRETVVGSTVS